MGLRLYEEANVKECPVCGGHLRHQLVNVCACETLPAIIVGNVPASVCEVCGEKVLAQEVIDVFQRIHSGDSPPAKTIPCNYYDFQEARKFKKMIPTPPPRVGQIVDIVRIGGGYSASVSTMARESIPAIMSMT